MYSWGRDDSGIVAQKCRLAALPMVGWVMCGMTGRSQVSESALMRRASVSPPHFTMSGWRMSGRAEDQVAELPARVLVLACGDGHVQRVRDLADAP